MARKHDPFDQGGSERQAGVRWHRLVLLACTALTLVRAADAAACATQKCRDIDAFFGPLDGQATGVAPHPAPPPEAGIAAGTDPASFTSTPIIIHRAQRQTMRQPRETAQLSASLYAGTMSDHGGTLIEILHTGRVHMAARTPWTNRAPGVDDTPAFLSRFHPEEPFQPAGLMMLFEAHVGYPAGQQILWPLEQLSDIQLVCALCRGSSFSQFAGQGRLVLQSEPGVGPELSGAMEDMRLTGADGTVTGFFRFSRADVAAPVTLAETDQMQLDFGAGLHLFGGDIMLWQPAHDRAAGIIAGTPEDVFSDLGGVLIYFSPSPQ